VLEEAGLGDASDLLISAALIDSHLWLPVSLIEVAFRNVADRVVSQAHPRGKNWLFADGAGGDTLIAAEVVGLESLHRKRSDGINDPVAVAARQAAEMLSRPEITRDDLIAHLMFGFWVIRVPTAVNSLFSVFGLIAPSLGSPLSHESELRDVMVNEVLRIRNRLAHHEPLLIRSKHVFAKKTGTKKAGSDLVTSLLSAIEKFEKETTKVIETARLMVPMAARHLEHVEGHVQDDLEPLRSLLLEREVELKRQSAERRAARRPSGTMDS
jgi:hypothetical protein